MIHHTQPKEGSIERFSKQAGGNFKIKTFEKKVRLNWNFQKGKLVTETYQTTYLVQYLTPFIMTW